MLISHSRPPLQQWPPVLAPVDVSLSADGRAALLVGEETVSRWAVGGKGAKTVAGTRVSDARFGADGRTILTAGAGGADLLDLASRRGLAELRAGARGMTAAGFSADGRRVVTGDEVGTARVWEPGVVPLGESNVPDLAVAGFSRDGSRVASLGIGGSGPIVWEASRGAPAAAPAGFGTASSPAAEAEFGRHASVGFSPDGRRLFSANAGTFDVWEEDAATVRRVSTTDADASSADGRRIARLAQDGAAVDVRDADSSSRVARVSLTRPGADLVALSPDGRRVAAFKRGSDSVEVKDVREGARGATLRMAGDRLDAVRFSPDGRRLLVALAAGSARIWDIAGRRALSELSGHVRPLWSTAFSADGRFVVTGGSDDTTRVWETATGRSVAVFRSGGGAAFAPGARAVVTIAGLTPGESDVSAIRACEACATWPELLRRAEARATRELTPAERRRYIDD